MKTVKTTLFPESKNRDLYFDAEEFIREYQEEKGKISEHAIEMIRNYATIINRAYEEGYRDGMEEIHK